MWPVARHFWSQPPNREKRWHDFVSRYLLGYELNFSGTQASSVEPQIWDVKDRNNVLWGCPSWRRVTQAGGTVAIDSGWHPGYAMSLYPEGPDMSAPFPQNLRRNRAWIDLNDPTGRYYRQTQWRNPAENGLIAESTHANLAVPLPPYPFLPEGSAAFPEHPDALATVGSLDFNRHSRRTAGNHPDVPTMNMLFADGHAKLVSYREAYRAIVKQ